MATPYKSIKLATKKVPTFMRKIPIQDACFDIITQDRPYKKAEF